MLACSSCAAAEQDEFASCAAASRICPDMVSESKAMDDAGSFGIAEDSTEASETARGLNSLPARIAVASEQVPYNTRRLCGEWCVGASTSSLTEEVPEFVRRTPHS